MACDLTGGRAKPCKDAVGGIRKIHFVDFADLGDITLTDDEVTDMDGTFDYHTYDVKGNSSLETNIQTSLHCFSRGPRPPFLRLLTSAERLRRSSSWPQNRSPVARTHLQRVH